MAEDKLPVARPSRLWRVVLVLSLALNLAVAGVIIGAVTSGRASDGPPRSFDLGIGPIARALEPQERRAIARDLRRDRSLRALDFRGRATEMVETLRAEPFDAVQFRALMDAQVTAVSGLQSKAQDATLDQIIAMTPERRRAFADRVAEELSRMRAPRTRNSGG